MVLVAHTNGMSPGISTFRSIAYFRGALNAATIAACVRIPEHVYVLDDHTCIFTLRWVLHTLTTVSRILKMCNIESDIEDEMRDEWAASVAAGDETPVATLRVLTALNVNDSENALFSPRMPGSRAYIRIGVAATHMDRFRGVADFEEDEVEDYYVDDDEDVEKRRSYRHYVDPPLRNTKGRYGWYFCEIQHAWSTSPRCGWISACLATNGLF